MNLAEIIGLLRHERVIRGITLEGLGKKIGRHRSAISKTEDLRDNPTVKALVTHAEALGYKLILSLEKIEADND